MEREEYLTLVRKHKIGPLVSRLNRQPRPVAELSARQGDAQLLERLLSGKVLVQRDGMIYVNTLLLDPADRLMLRKICNKFALDLAEAVAALRPEIYSLLAAYPRPGVQVSVLAGAAVGCLFLLQNAAYYLEAAGLVDGGGNLCLASGPGILALTTANGFTFYSYGDTKGSFPELINAGITGPPVFRELSYFRLTELAADAAKILAAVFNGCTSVREIKHAYADIQGEKLLGLLVEQGYLVWEGDNLVMLVPWWGPAQSELLLELEGSLLQVLMCWHQQNYSVLQASLQSLRPLENGISFHDVYSVAWPLIAASALVHLRKLGLVSGGATVAEGQTVKDIRGLLLPRAERRRILE